MTGPGGTGKTRLALQIAADILDRWPDGVFFVNLAPPTDPDLLLPTRSCASRHHPYARGHGVLAKPSDVDDLLAWVREHLGTDEDIAS